jgi:hypothetical protein
MEVADDGVQRQVLCQRRRASEYVSIMPVLVYELMLQLGGHIRLLSERVLLFLSGTTISTKLSYHSFCHNMKRFVRNKEENIDTLHRTCLYNK